MQNLTLASLPVRLALGLLLVLSLAASAYMAYPAIQARRENARLKGELLRLKKKKERLRGRLDSLQTGKRPAPTYYL